MFERYTTNFLFSRMCISIFFFGIDELRQMMTTIELLHELYFELFTNKLYSADQSLHQLKSLSYSKSILFIQKLGTFTSLWSSQTHLF